MASLLQACDHRILVSMKKRDLEVMVSALQSWVSDPQDMRNHDDKERKLDEAYAERHIKLYKKLLRYAK